MKKLIFLSFVFLLPLMFSGCAAISTASDWINGNPMIVNSVTRQAVARYVQGGDTLEEQRARAENVKIRTERALADLEGNPQATVAGIMDVLESHVDWDGLSPADRFLVQDIMLVVQTQLAQKQAENQLQTDTVLAVRSLLRTAISAATLLI